MAILTLDNFLPGIAVSDQQIAIPIASLPELMKTEVGANLGFPGNADAAEFIRCFTNKVFTQILAMSPESRPTNISATKGNRTLVTGSTDDWVQPYTLTFRLRPESVSAAPES